MKTIITISIIATILLGICWFLSLIRDKNTKTTARWTNFILPLFVLVMFVSLFVGGSISRNHIKKELVTLSEETTNRNINPDINRNDGPTGEDLSKEDLSKEDLSKEDLSKEDLSKEEISNEGLSNEELHKKELSKEVLLKELEKKNANISLIIGPDTTIESLINLLRLY